MGMLAKSRGKFFNDHKMPPINFWVYFLRLSNAQHALSDSDLTLAKEWHPNRSNCPELDWEMEYLIERMPPAWRTLTEEVFVGRTFDGEVNASAWTANKARVVEITLQYTTVLYAYVSAYDEWGQAIKKVFTAFKEKDPDVACIAEEADSEAVQRLWNALEEGRADWANSTLITPLMSDLADVTNARAEFRERAVLASEMWVVCHEVAHHLLGHTVKSGGFNLAQDLVDDYFEVIKRDGLNRSQIQECKADVLAFLMLAGKFSREIAPRREALYRAEIGSILGLVTLAHVNDVWLSDDQPDATHPDFVTRFLTLINLAERLSENMLPGNLGDHPLDLLIDLRAFASHAMNVWLSRIDSGRFRRLTLLDSLDWLLQEKRKLRETLVDASVTQ